MITPHILAAYSVEEIQVKACLFDILCRLCWGSLAEKDITLIFSGKANARKFMGVIPSKVVKQSQFRDVAGRLTGGGGGGGGDKILVNISWSLLYSNFDVNMGGIMLVRGNGS